MRRTSLFLLLAAAGCGASASPPATVDPVAGPASIAIPSIAISTAPGDVAHGKEIFTKRGCQVCHKLGGGKLIGPDLQGVTARRDPRWIARMILRPDVMLREDAAAKDLFRTHLVPMVNQQIDANAELPALLAYLKANEQ